MTNFTGKRKEYEEGNGYDCAHNPKVGNEWERQEKKHGHEKTGERAHYQDEIKRDQSRQNPGKSKRNNNGQW